MILYTRHHRFCGTQITQSKNVFAIARVLFAAIICVGMTGCGSILPKAPIQPTLYVLDAVPPPPAVAALQARASAPTLTVNTPVASAGFGGIHIVYQRQPHELEHFALSQWIDTPVQMLTPLIVRTLEGSGAFRAVVRGSTAAASELRLDTELIRLQQEFGTVPSHVRLTLRAVMVDTATRRVIGSREFDASVVSPTDDPGGGVIAANQAVQHVLADLAKFCAEAAGQ